MLSTQMMKLAEQNQWKVNAKEETVFGEYNGYLFTALEGKRFKAYITPLAGISPDALDSVLRFLGKNKKALHLRNFEVTDNFLCVRQEEGMLPLTVDKMEYILAQVSGLLSLHEVPARACVVCGQPAGRRGLYLGLLCHLHQECEDKDMVDYTGSQDDGGSEPSAQPEPPAVPEPEQSAGSGSDAESDGEPEHAALEADQPEDVAAGLDRAPDSTSQAISETERETASETERETGSQDTAS